MNRKKIIAWVILVVSAVAMAWPLLSDYSIEHTPDTPVFSSDTGQFLWLGSTRQGEPFGLKLLMALGASGGIALAGALGALLGAVLLGMFEASLSSKRNRALIQLVTIGAMAMPNVTLLITVHGAFPRETPSLLFNTALIGVLAALWVPPASRLIASRVQSIRAKPFFVTTVNMGASRWHLLRKDTLPHLVEDIAWLFAGAFPMFIHVELGLAYIGMEYKQFAGLGRLLKSSYDRVDLMDPYMYHLVIASLAAVYLSLLPMTALVAFGINKKS